jgi:hypothetical protein
MGFDESEITTPCDASEAAVLAISGTSKLYKIKKQVQNKGQTDVLSLTS